ncbi:BlaI/MecI/CopY family transcriptional regulator [Haloferula sp. BvORR071]|uniref:BlaI/MecI/CopY family transcriptional regulator n=1 Tax=Haloferula sp. BvORR071 TaxID=1396141 RepID=UPI000697AF44|nr:BlaI/MecI/CopY family transcriptional regulator [Haloferula sp. BvORR071]
MARKKTPEPLSGLSRRETEIMEILFALGEATVSGVTEKMPADLSPNGVRTMLTILEGKGRVTRRKEGREYFYKPATDPAVAGQSALQQVLRVFFDGSLKQALQARFTGSGAAPDAAEIAELEAVIREAKRQAKGGEKP